MDNLETVANVSDTHLTLAFRKNISGIHQRLGEISLKIDEKEDPNLVAWVQTATTRAGLLDEQVSSLQEKFDEQSEVIKRLELHFEELSKASKEHEETLLQKCCELLNEKKGKIRDQQRLLAVAKIDPAKGTSTILYSTQPLQFQGSNH